MTKNILEVLVKLLKQQQQDESIKHLTKRIDALEKDAIKRKRDTENENKQWREKIYHNVG